MQYHFLEDAPVQFIFNPFFLFEKGGIMSQLIILLYLNTSRISKQGTAPLLIRLTLNGARKHINTGFHLNPKHWNREKHVVKSNHPQAKDIAKVLSDKKKALEDAFYRFSVNNSLVSLDEFMVHLGEGVKKEHSLIELFEQHNSEMENRLGVDYTYSTFEKYIVTLKKLKSFLAEKLGRKDLPLTKVTLNFIHDFSIYLRKEHENQHNTVVKYAKNLKRVMNLGVQYGWVDKNPFDQFKMGYKVQERIYLSKEELELIEKKQFKLDRLNLVRDLFLLQCYTGLAYADLFKLTGREVTTGIDGNKWIITKRKKTDVRSSIPLLPKALLVIEKYNPEYSSKPDNNLLPVFANQKFNLYLHEIAELCGIDKNLTSHVGRRTFATTVALANGVSIETISKVLGHSSTKITHQYAMTTDLKVSEEMKKIANVV